MAAKDYKICCAMFNAYIGKQSKRNPDMITEDRRVISEGEILELIHWWVTDKLRGKDSNIQVITHGGEPVVEVKLLKREETE